MTQSKVKIHYRYSIIWPIFWGILFFPIALALLMTGSSFVLNENTYIFEYGGSRFWLCFWLLAFFPIAFFLLFINGMSVTTLTENENKEIVIDEVDK
jgi:hypothetical protein